jgi:hypothetical protein
LSLFDGGDHPGRTASFVYDLVVVVLAVLVIGTGASWLSLGIFISTCFA